MLELLHLFNQKKIDKNWMVYTNVFFVRVVRQVVQVTDEIVTNIQVQPFHYKHIAE